MHKLPKMLVLLATASSFWQGPLAAEPSYAVDVSGARNAVVLVGGMGGGTGGGMGGGTGGMSGGAGGMGTGGMGTGGMGGMTGGGMTGMMGRGIDGGTTGYGDPPRGGGDPYGRSETTGDGPQPTQYRYCVTQHGQCSVSSTWGSLRTGASCSCLYGGKGKIK
jgi:hypothetical protein